MASALGGDWVPMAEAARLAETPYNCFRRRMHRLNKLSDGAILRNVGCGKRPTWLVSPKALRDYQRTDPEVRDEQISHLRKKIDLLSEKIEQERKVNRSFRARAGLWFRTLSRPNPT